MKVAERLFSRNQWISLLNHFADLVADKEYVKINYKDWRSISKPAASDVGLELCSGLDGVPNIFIHYGAHDQIMLEADDSSLGDFLFNNIFSKEEQVMAYSYDNITAASSSSTVSALNLKSNYDGTHVSNKYDNSATTTDTVTITGDSISTSNKTYQLNIDGYDNTQVYDWTTWSNIGTTGNIGIVDRTDELANKIDQRPTFNDVNKMIDDKMKEKENVNMKGFNFDFGPCGNTVRLSMYGMAIQNISGEWVSYNPDSHEIINVDVFSMADGGKYIYKMPVAIADVKIGDIVIHSRVPMFVTAVNENGTFDVIDVHAGETKTVIPTRSPFGFNFMTKIISLFDGMTTPDKNNPFGNMWMFAMLSDDKSFDIKDMMMISMMTGKNNLIGDMNPMMMMLMMSDNSEKNDWLMPLMLMNQSHTC